MSYSHGRVIIQCPYSNWTTLAPRQSCWIQNGTATLIREFEAHKMKYTYATPGMPAPRHFTKKSRKPLLTQNLDASVFTMALLAVAPNWKPFKAPEIGLISMQWYIYIETHKTVAIVSSTDGSQPCHELVRGQVQKPTHWMIHFYDILEKEHRERKYWWLPGRE